MRRELHDQMAAQRNLHDGQTLSILQVGCYMLHQACPDTHGNLLFYAKSYAGCTRCAMKVVCQTLRRAQNERACSAAAKHPELSKLQEVKHARKVQT